ncbi:molybdopterin guanine dinucleotide-containing S/N-oxide reductase [Campylobacter gracilis]|uniref:Molybdopterin guanine dinucleotide-containing S/N-oxide reductase n=1 Tax=Campylobacter gracilis RM3268 TaxID=553220 RepID=C8PKT4_9BACT|nr:molybdopterin guanine dinucleotide-containing S/N-oxide reductase [Campylobacter gracilis]AKT91502.1 molybdopterin-containing oxidoreductase II, DMSO/TMAO/BSO reductase family, catalytic subunit [Campylobacter gracilis]EEV16693.1 molybdopterin guanine dinucleotide-containing S/N-oxide reductase [Campylobacter gracilis RM3268]UEB46288.1 molybdopterin guanine dinucleotide-containing S/N-oxide reductase [Campylobacter gracilis]SUW78061.1 trimethylamine-n-oxide reductase 2 [Campylobacter gracili
MKRRNFLKLGAAVSALPLIPSSMLAADKLTALKKNGEILTAARWGILKASVKNGKIVKSAPWKIISKIPNTLQNTMADLVYNTRIKAPMVRKSYLADPDNPKPELRGLDEWVEVKYEDAIKLVARELKKTREQKGADSVFAGSYGWQSTGNVHVSRTLLHRFMNLTGGFTGVTGDYSTGAAQVIMPHVTGSNQVYEQQTSWPVVLENSKVVVFWGLNPISTLRVAWTSSDEQGFKYFEQLKNSDKEIIIIDPIKTVSGKYFEGKARWIAPRPNTDVAMMLGMAQHLYSQGKYDKEFLQNYTVGFEKFVPYLTGQSDGAAKTPEWASEICGISADVIKELAIKFYENRTMIMAGWGIQRAHHGEQAHWMIVTLCAMLGQIGLAGGGFGFSYHYANGGAPTCAGGVIGGMNAASVGIVKDGKFLGLAQDQKQGGEAAQAWLVNTAKVAFPLARIADALLNPGKTIDANGAKITYPKIDFIYWVGGNPIVHHQDTNTNIKAWRKPRTIVVNEIYWTPTAKMADIVFPTTTQYERNDITMSGDYSNMHIIPMKQVVAKQHGAKDDYQIFTDLCKAYADGLAEVYTDGGKTEMDWIKEFYKGAAGAVNANTALGIQMPSFEQWWEKNEPTEFYETPESAAYVSFEDFRNDPVLEALGTPSGLIEIYSDTIEAMNYKDCGAHPMWFEPVEWLGMKDKPAKFHLLSLHPLDRLHSQQSNTSNRKRYAIADREPVLINTEDAKELGIKQGDLVRVYNARGEILAGANVSDDIMRGVVQIFEGAWYDPNAEGLCKNGNPNVLTIDLPTSELANGNIAHTALVDIELYKHKAGEDIKLTAFMPPKGAK